MKRGRPPIEDPRTHQYRLRLNDEEYAQLQYLFDAGVKVSDLFRTVIGHEYTMRIKMDKEKNMRGQRFGKLTAVRYVRTSPNGHAMWECICDCGNTSYHALQSLRSGRAKSCGCIPCGAHRIDITGQRFGKLTAVSYSRSDNGRHSIWTCICDCGNTCEVSSVSLRSGHTKSCGCSERNLKEKGEVV